MRTDNSLKNSLSSLALNSISMVIGFIAQALFIRILNAEYLGLNGLFSNILSMLNIFELGIGSAIVFNMYKPIAENDEIKIKQLINFYKKIYSYIAFIIFIIGLMIMPFLSYFVGEINIKINIYLVYLLVLSHTVISYFIAYKRSLLYAYQKNYIINIIHIFYILFLNVFQLLFLYFTKNYYIYLVLKIIFQIFENCVISKVAEKKYSILKQKDDLTIDIITKQDIFSKVKALFFHKVGGALVLGSDNIIISKFFGVVTVGLYSNYYMIINAVNTLFAEIISSSTASVGNLLATENFKKRFDIFKKIRFLNFWLACFSGICITLMIQPFISIWVGSEYLLSNNVVFVLIINYYQKMMRRTYGVFKDAAGIWREDRFIPLIESISNIIFSILFLKMFGLSGVFLGTIFSGLILWLYSYPKFVYKKLFNRGYINYFIETIGYLLLFVFLLVMSYVICLFFNKYNYLVQFVINFFVSIIVPNILLILIFNKTDKFIYFKQLIKEKILKKVKTHLHY